MALHKINLPESTDERIVIIGGGFGGLSLARRLVRQNYQVVLLDRHNYHQFQPLFYQVAMSGLEPASISFPFRKLFNRYKNFFFRVTEVERINAAKKQVETSDGVVNYDHLIIATGATTNFFGNEKIAKHALPMKSVPEALFLRNEILADYEKALTTIDYEERQKLIDIVIVGGGPTGVEVAGALAEMKKYVLPKDYRELDTSEIDIYLVQASGRLLEGMSDEAGDKAKSYLEDLGVHILLNAPVRDYDGETVQIAGHPDLPAHKVIWAAGVTGDLVEGLSKDDITRGNRIKVDQQCRVIDYENIYAVGDIALMATEDFPRGHPQVAQGAIQMGDYLAKYFKNLSKGKSTKPFKYHDKGSMATIGRNKAVVDMPNGWKLQGFFAWFIWLAVHLFALIGTRNKVIVFINWVWNYVRYDQSLRLLIRPKVK